MSELTDDQLDGLFRKSAEEFDPPFDPAAWQDMKTRLDTHDRPTPGGGTPLWRNLLRWGLPICMLLLMVGGLFFYRRNATSREAASGNVVSAAPAHIDTHSEVVRAATQQPEAAKQTQPNNPVSAPTTSAALSAQSADPAKQSTELRKPAGEQPATTSALPKVQKQPDGFVNGSGEMNRPATASETKEPIVAYGQKRNSAKAVPMLTDRASATTMEHSIPRVNEPKRSGQRTGKTITERTSKRKQPRIEWLNVAQDQLATNKAVASSPTVKKRSSKTTLDERHLAATNTSENFIQPVTDQAEPAGLPAIRELTIRPANWPKPLVFTKHAIDLPPTELVEVSTVVPKSPVERGLSVRLAIAPDLSSIGLKNFARPGTNVGVLLEYRLASRWSIQTGIIQSTKIYKASGSEYELSDYYKKGMYTLPEGVDGQCKMLDIPINVRYDFFVSPKADGRSPNRWFITGGVTSYFIEQEDYAYKYTGYAHKPVPDWSGKSGNYGFSQLNLSVGYERAVTKRLSWQIEPFMKMPLKKVGYLNLNLLSTGAFFSIRYKL